MKAIIIFAIVLAIVIIVVQRIVKYIRKQQRIKYEKRHMTGLIINNCKLISLKFHFFQNKKSLIFAAGY